MPTPPIGDMACAASPMQSRPGRCQLPQPIDRDGQQLDLSPKLFDLVDPVAQNIGIALDDVGAERRQPLRVAPPRCRPSG